MEDRGEKIIFLAREILEAETLEEAPAEKKKTRVTMSFKTLCFTTILAAASGNLVSTYVHEQTRPLNKYERIDLQALVFYAAKLKNVDEAFLRREVEKQVDVAHFDEITAKEFPAARRYLQEKAQ